MMRAYLAGPDVFFKNAAEIAREKIAICAGHGIEALHPAAANTAGKTWRAIYDLDIAMLMRCDLVIANLTPFRGISADPGTLVELGMAFWRGMKLLAYTNDGRDLATRIRALPEDGYTIEDFGRADNLMIEGAIAQSGGAIFAPGPGIILPDSDLTLFRQAVAAAR